ncbi:hypothetical protein ACET3Z_027131 [Daucus carota]
MGFWRCAVSHVIQVFNTNPRSFTVASWILPTLVVTKTILQRRNNIADEDLDKYWERYLKLKDITVGGETVSRPKEFKKNQ